MGGILNKATLGRYWVGDAVVLVLATALLQGYWIVDRLVLIQV